MPQKMKQMATIDCEMITISVTNGDSTVEYGLDTASKIQVDIQTETQDAVKLIIKGVVKAQKKKEVTVTGNQITLTDNVFTPELVKILQGGTITYDTEDTSKIVSYAPPVAGTKFNPPVFTLNAYSAEYNAAGMIVQYEKVSYPNCTGNPIAMSAEDNVFRVNEYTIDSAPNTGEAPYKITYVPDLPTLTEPTV